MTDAEYQENASDPDRPPEGTAATADTDGTAIIQRDHLLTGAVGRHVDRIEAYRVRLDPGRQAGLHLHAGGVAGLVIEGRIAYQLRGEEVRELQAGSAFYDRRAPPSAVSATSPPPSPPRSSPITCSPATSR